jgi:hypothetical protein
MDVEDSKQEGSQELPERPEARPNRQRLKIEDNDYYLPLLNTVA